MTATADLDLAFAGPAALAELVRAREVAPARAGRALPAADRGARPAAERVPGHVRRQALAEAEQAAGADGPLAGVPIAVKDDLAVAGQAVTRGSRSFGPPATADAEVVRRLRAAGAIPIGITNVPELMIFPWTATERQRDHPQPVEPRAHAGRLVGRLGGAVAAGTGRGRDGVRRRRLDPDPGRLLRAGGDEADPRPGAVATRRPGVAGAVGLRGAGADGRATARCCST